jgi:hypothetical protein
MRASYSNACEVPAGGPRQSCVLEVPPDVSDVAWIDGCRLHLNECFPNARLRNRYFFDGPNSVKRNDLITFVLMALQSNVKHRATSDPSRIDALHA